MWDKVIYTLDTTQPTWVKNKLKTEKYKELYLLRVRKSMTAILYIESESQSLTN